MGFSFVFKAFAIIIIGGLGNIAGAAIAAVMLGVIESSGRRPAAAGPDRRRRPSSR